MPSRRPSPIRPYSPIRPASFSARRGCRGPGNVQAEPANPGAAPDFDGRAGLDVAADGASVYDEGANRGRRRLEAFSTTRAPRADPASFPARLAPTGTSTTTEPTRPPTPRLEQ